jgi:DNA polymerase III subunit beta
MSATIKVPVSIIAAASHAMAKQDIRYYLNGMMIEKSSHGGVRVVATNGHHLIVVRSASATIQQRKKAQYIIPGKMILSIIKAAKQGMEVEFKVSSNGQVSARISDVTFHEKIIEARYPDWEKTIPEDDTVSGPVEVAPQYIDSAIKAHSSLCKFEGRGTKYNGIRWHMRGNNKPLIATFGDALDEVDALAVIMPLHCSSIESYKAVKV